VADGGESKQRGRRPAFIVGSVVIPIAVALAAIAWQHHDGQVSEFRAAKKDCERSMAALVGTLYTEQGAAEEHAFAPPPPVKADTELFNGITGVQRDCFLAEPLRVPAAPYNSDFDTQSHVVDFAWLFSNMPSGDPSKTMEEASLGEGYNYFSGKLESDLENMQEPSLLDSFRDLIPPLRPKAPHQSAGQTT
jgi:hypothetical protein